LVTGVVVLRSDEASGRISPGSVGVVDPVAREVVGEVPVGFRSPLIAAGEGSVWVVDPTGKTLTRIDPETNAAVSAPQAIQRDGIPIGLAVGEGSVWIAMNEGRFLSVLEVGPDLGEVRRRIPLEERDSLFSRSLDPVKLAVGGGAVWALERGQGELTRINPVTGKPKLLRDGLGASSSIAVDRDVVWLGGPDGVRKLDARTGFELEEPSGPEEVHSSLTTSIAVGRDSVWFVGESSARLWRIRPASVTIHDSVEIGESPSAVAVGDDGAVWVASSALDSLSRYDPETGGVDEVELGTTSRGLVARFGRIWTSPGTTGG
jgi:streptogramin lyase